MRTRLLAIGLLIGLHGPVARCEIKDAAFNLDSKLNIKTVFYLQKPGSSIVPDLLIEDAIFTPEFLYSWSTWFETANNVRIDTAGWLELGMPYGQRWEPGIDILQDSETRSHPIVISELFATATSGPFDFVVGRAIRHNTLAVLYPLADRYVSRDFNDPVATKITGVWQARADYYLGDWQASMAVLPVFQPSRAPGIESRWWIREIEPITGEPIPSGTTGRVDRIVPDIAIENIGLLARMSTRGRHWDFFTSVYRGYSPYSVIRTEQPAPDDYLVSFDYVQGFEWAAGVSTTIDAVELHSEALYHQSDSGDDDNFVNALIGTIWRPTGLSQWLHCNQIHLAVEYAYEHVLKEQKASSGYVSSSKPFRLGRDTLFTKCLFEINSRDSASVAYVHDFAAHNFFIQLRGGHRFANGVNLELVLDLFGGEELYFGTWRNNNRIYLNYEYNF